MKIRITLLDGCCMSFNILHLYIGSSSLYFIDTEMRENTIEFDRIKFFKVIPLNKRE